MANISVSRFFDLPLELRDEIRGYLYEDVELTQTLFNTPVFTVRVPLLSVRLVSRRMKQEYDRRPHDGQIKTDIFRLGPLPHCTLNTTVFILSWQLEHRQWQLPTNTKYKKALTALLGQLSRLKEIRLILRLEKYYWRSMLDKIVENYSALTTIPHLSKITIVKMSRDEEGGEAGDLVLAEWRSTIGMTVHTKMVDLQKRLDVEICLIPPKPQALL